MREWMLLPVGLLIWFVLGLGIALLIGPVLRQRSESMEAIDADFAEGVAQPVDSR